MRQMKEGEEEGKGRRKTSLPVFPPQGYIALFGKNSGLDYFKCQEERFDPQIPLMLISRLIRDPQMKLKKVNWKIASTKSLYRKQIIKC